MNLLTLDTPFHVMSKPNTSLSAMIDSPEPRKFGRDKADMLPRDCRSYSVRFACNGECSKRVG